MADDRDQTGIADLIDDMLAQGLSCPLCGSRQPHRHTGVEIVCYQNGIKWARNSQRVSALERAQAREDAP